MLSEHIKGVDTVLLHMCKESVGECPNDCYKCPYSSDMVLGYIEQFGGPMKTLNKTLWDRDALCSTIKEGFVNIETN